LHVLVVAKTLASLGTAFADLSAGRANAPMEVRAPEHEIRAGLAYLGAVEQQPDMIRFGVLTAHVQAMRHSSQAETVTVHAFLNAPLQFGIHGVIGGVWHVVSPSSTQGQDNPNLTKDKN